MVKTVSVIICAYNNKEIIGDCLNSIKSQTFKDFECIIVDDASKDGTVDYVKKEYSWVRVISNKSNQGPSINRNKGIKNSTGKYIVTLDSDVILKKDWLEKQVAMLNTTKQAGIIGSKLLYYTNKNRINSIAGGLTRTGIGFDILKTTKKEKTLSAVYVCSAAMIMKREMINKVGMFDEEYFYGHEDTDLGWRANIAGYKVITNLEAIAYHRIGETMKKRPKILYFYATKNRIRSLIKNYEFHNLILYLPLLLVLTTIDILIRSRRIQKIKAIWWNIKNISKTLNKRIIVQKSRKTKDKELWGLFSKSLW